MFNPSADYSLSPNTRGDAPARMMNDVDLCVWVADASQATSLVYYTAI